MRLSFPLRDDYFPPVKVGSDRRTEWVGLMNTVLQQAILEEETFYENNYNSSDTKLWEHVKTENHVHAFRPTPGSPLHGRSVSNNIAIFSSVGTILGKVNDLLLGLRTVNNSEAALCAKFLECWLDVKILADLEPGPLPGQRDDQYSTLQLKWRVIKTPGGKIVRDRDITLLEHIGTTTDLKGRPIGYYSVYSVDVPEIPPFPDSCNLQRCQNKVIFIMRQLSDGRMGIFVYGESAMDGNMSKFVEKKTILGVFFQIISKSLEFAEAKKLTILALSNSPVLNPDRRYGKKSPQTLVVEEQSIACGICKQSHGKFLGGLKKMLNSSKIPQCLVCGMLVCQSCSVPASLLATKVIVSVNCCKSCIIQAQRMSPRLYNNQIEHTDDDESFLGSSGRTDHSGRSNSSSSHSFSFKTLLEKDWAIGLSQSIDATAEYLEELKISGSGARSASKLSD